MERRRRVGTVHRHDVHAGEHLIQAFPVGRLQPVLDVLVQAVPVVIVDRQPEPPRPAGDGLADPAHAHDAQPLAPYPVAQHPGRGPVLPVAEPDGALAFRQPPRNREDQRHRHVGGVLGEHPRRVGDRDAAPFRRPQIDVVDAGREAGDQPQVVARPVEDVGVQPVGDRRHEDVGPARGVDQLLAAEGVVVEIEIDLEQLHHPRFDRVGEFSRDDDGRAVLGHEGRGRADTGALRSAPSSLANASKPHNRRRRRIAAADAARPGGRARESTGGIP